MDNKLEKVIDDHMALRVKILSGWKPTPYLTEYLDIQTDFQAIFEKLCAGPCSHAIQECYMKYLAFSGNTNPVIDPKQLPSSKKLWPILDHLAAVVLSQPVDEAGGSYKSFLKQNLDLCIDNRVPTATLKPTVHTITFGHSSKTELEMFLASFNANMEEIMTAKPGYLPLDFYSFDVEYILRTSNQVFKVYSSKSPSIPCDTQVPSRIIFGLWNERFEIALPWTVTTDKTTGGEIHAFHFADKCFNMWNKIFSKIRGYAIGIDTFQKVKDLAAFFQNHVNSSITVGLKMYDLNMILALTGVEMSEISLPTLTLMFTGDILPTPTQFNVEIGKFCGIYLPEYLNIHLQLKSIAVMNIATICKLSVLVNLFPTPGIACLVTRMTPTRFFAWVLNCIF